MGPLKEAFHKVKEDIFYLDQEMQVIKSSLEELKQEMVKLCGAVEKLSENFKESSKKDLETSTKSVEGSSAHASVSQATSTHSSTVPQEIGGLKPKNLGISTGNEGVPADRQTNQQTDRQEEFGPKNFEKAPAVQKSMSLENASEVLNSLDALKKEIRLKFKRLTDQEILVFSVIYQLEEEKGEVDYKCVAERLKLTESSIRDYVARLIKKGIPVDKKRVNNKQINLSISQNLKKIASLNTILQLRGL